MKPVIKLMATLGGIASLALAGLTSCQQAPKTDLVQVRRGDLLITVDADGNLDMPKKFKLSFGTPGIVRKVDVKVGDSVKKGQTLAKLDTVALELALTQAQSNLKSAEYVLTYSPADRAVEEARAQAAMAEIQVTLDRAEKAVKDASKNDAMDITRQEAAVSLAESMLQTAQRNLQSARIPHDATRITSLESAVAEARVAVDAAVKALDEAQKADNVLVVSQQAVVADARNTLTVALDNLDKARSPSADLGVARDSLGSGRLGLQNARALVVSGQTPYNTTDIANALVDLSQVVNDLDVAQRKLTAAANVVTVAPGLPNDIRDVATRLAATQTAVEVIQTALGGTQNSFLVVIPQKKKMVESAQASFVYAQNLYLEKHITATQLQTYITALQQNQQSLDAERQGLTDTLDASKTNIDNADYRLGQMQVDLSEVMKRSDPLGLGAKETLVVRARAALADAEKTLADLQEPLYVETRQKDVTKARAGLSEALLKLQEAQAGTDSLNVTTAESAVTKAQADLAEARKALDDLKDPVRLSIRDGERQKDVVKAQAALADARKKLDDIKAGAIAADIEVKKAQVAYLRQLVDKLKKDISDATITAPADAYVSAVAAEEGMGIPGEAAAITLIDSSEVEMTATVSDIDVIKVMIGQQASIKLDALPETSISATVKSISPAGRVKAGVMNYDLVFTVQAPAGLELRSGMAAVAKIAASRKENVLLVPDRLVKDREKAPSIEVVQGKNVELRAITIGQSNGVEIEVVSGLSEGETVR